MKRWWPWIVWKPYIDTLVSNLIFNFQKFADPPARDNWMKLRILFWKLDFAQGRSLLKMTEVLKIYPKKIISFPMHSFKVNTPN